MEPEAADKAAEISSIEEKRVSFSRVTDVATGWMLDFSFVCLCKHFKEGKLDEFNQTLSTFQAISEGNVTPRNADRLQKKKISAFLARIMHGKQLDTQYEEDDQVMPLMSAANMWSTMRDTVADEHLFNNISRLLVVQSVAVCLDKGQRSMASSALKWFQKKQDFPQSLGVKLSTIMTQRDTYHPFLLSFSFNRLLEDVQSFVDSYLEKNPSDYLLQAATKTVQSSENMEVVGRSETREETVSQTPNRTAKNRKSKEATPHLRAKRKLLSTKLTDVWKPDSCKKPTDVLKRICENETFHLAPPQQSPRKSVNTSWTNKQRKPPRKWNYELDKNLKAGVKRHGIGKWSLILQDYDFEGRTGTMLKDRWRILLKTHKVS